MATHHYVAAAGNEKAHCAECGSTIVATLGVTAGVLAAVAVALVIISRCYDRLDVGSKESLAAFRTRFGLASKLKILVGFYMIATQVGSVYEVLLPQEVQVLLYRMSVIVTLGINLALRVTPLACVGLSGYVSELLFWLILPVILLMMILASAAVRDHLKTHTERPLLRWSARRTIISKVREPKS